MKKYIILMLAVVSVSVLCGTSRAGTDPKETQETLTRKILGLVVQMDEAADDDNMPLVIETASAIKGEVKKLEGKTTPQQRQQVALIQVATNDGYEDRYTPGYALFRAAFADEFLALARVINGEKTLADTIRENPSLAQDGGVVGYLQGKVKYMDVRYLPIAEAFKRWKNCAYEVAAAQKEGVVAKSPKDFCGK